MIPNAAAMESTWQPGNLSLVCEIGLSEMFDGCTSPKSHVNVTEPLSVYELVQTDDLPKTLTKAQSA